MTRHAVRPEHAARGDDLHGGRTGQPEGGRRALGPGPADVGVVEYQQATAPQPRTVGRPARRTRRVGDACARAPLDHDGAGRRPARPSRSARCRPARAPGRAELRTGAPWREQPGRGRVGRRRPGRSHGPRGRRRRGRAPWDEACARLGHGRLLVTHEHRVERARERAEPDRGDGGQGQGEALARPRGRRNRRPRLRRGRSRAGRPRVRVALPGRGQAVGSGSGRCRRKVPVARLTSAPSAARSDASP